MKNTNTTAPATTATTAALANGNAGRELDPIIGNGIVSLAEGVQGDPYTTPDGQEAHKITDDVLRLTLNRGTVEVSALLEDMLAVANMDPRYAEAVKTIPGKDGAEDTVKALGYVNITLKLSSANAKSENEAVRGITLTEVAAQHAGKQGGIPLRIKLNTERISPTNGKKYRDEAVIGWFHLTPAGNLAGNLVKDAAAILANAYVSEGGRVYGVIKNVGKISAARKASAKTTEAEQTEAPAAPAPARSGRGRA